MLEPDYVRALETRLAWLRWGLESGREVWNAIAVGSPERTAWNAAMDGYIKNLQQGDTYCMDRKFCSLVEHARQTVPDDLAFDSTWLQSREGWLWLAEPFVVPRIQNQEINANIKVAAIGWAQVPVGTQIYNWEHTTPGDDTSMVKVPERVTSRSAVHILTYQDLGQFGTGAPGFGCWSYFTLEDGGKVLDRVRKFEQHAMHASGAYPQDRTTDMNHEIRWVYAALYLMAQRLSITVNHSVDRATRRRAEREGREMPSFLRVVTLRRLQADKDKAKPVNPIDWQWQWEVRGHWRNQYYPSTNEHKPVFVEAYIKGPEDRPLKPPTHSIFVARR